MKIQNFLTIVTASIECVFFAGIIYGWPSLEFVLLKEGYFSYLCNGTSKNSTLYTNVGNKTLSCPASNSKLNLVFTIGTSAMMILLPVGGYIFDRFGTWVYRTGATLMLTLGVAVMAIATPETADLLFVGVTFIGIGGLNLLVSNIKVAALCPSFRASFVTLYNGSYDSGAIMFFIFKTLHDSGLYKLKDILIVYCFCTLYCWVITYTLRPKKWFSETEVQPKYGVFQWGSKCGKEKDDSKETDRILGQDNEDNTTELPNSDVENELDNRSLKECICTNMFLTTQIFMSSLNLIVVYFLGSYETWLKSFVKPNEVSTLTSTLGVLLLLGIVVAPLNGLTTDLVKKLCLKIGYNRYKSTWLGLFAATAISTLFAVLFTLCLALHQVYPAFFLFILMRSFLYASNTAVIAIAFPFRHFGTLLGISMMISGITALGQFGIFFLAVKYDPDFTTINYIMIGVAALTVVHPLDVLSQVFKVP
ncbi:equilibrative nucleobase transporter 1-like [Ciona intestinalis]